MSSKYISLHPVPVGKWAKLILVESNPGIGKLVKMPFKESWKTKDKNHISPAQEATPHSRTPKGTEVVGRGTR